MHTLCTYSRFPTGFRRLIIFDNSSHCGPSFDSGRSHAAWGRAAVTSALMLFGLSGCATMGKVHATGETKGFGQDYVMETEPACGPVADALQRQAGLTPSSSSTSGVVQVTCSTRPSRVTFRHNGSDAERRIARRGWKYLSDARAVIYDADGRVVADAWAGVGHRAKISTEDRAEISRQLGSALATRLGGEEVNGGS